MRTESCRKCGKEVQIKQNCDVCSIPIKFECKDCQIESEEQIHSICRLVDMNKRSLASQAV